MRSFFTSVLLITISSFSSAQLVNKGDYILDTRTNIEWLKVNKTLDISYENLDEELLARGYEGFKLATPEQITSLRETAGVYNGTRSLYFFYAYACSLCADREPYYNYLGLISIMGSIPFNGGTGSIVHGVFGDFLTLADGSLAMNSLYAKCDYRYELHSPYNRNCSIGLGPIKSELVGENQRIGYWLARKRVTNTPPTFVPMEHQLGNENELLSFGLGASDLEDNNLFFSADNLPEGATFDTDTGLFSWTPTFDQAGEYAVLFSVSDDGEPSMSSVQEVTILIGNANRAPVIDDISPISIEENESVSVQIKASDPDADPISLFVEGLPGLASFTNNVFSWTPGFLDSGNYVVDFVAMDQESETRSSLILTVGNTTDPLALCDYNEQVINSMSLEKNVRNSYTANNKKVCFFIERGKVTAALNQIEAVEKKITVDLDHSVIAEQDVIDLQALLWELRVLIDR